MPMFSPESFSKLSTCHPDLQTLFFEVVRKYDCNVLDVFKGEQDHKDAITVIPACNVHSHQDQNEHCFNMSRIYFFAGYVLGIAERLKAEGKMSYSVRWQGKTAYPENENNIYNLDANELNDLIHFELV